MCVCVCVGDTFIVSDIKTHDRRIPIPVFAEYSKGNFTAHPTPNLVKVSTCVCVCVCTCMCVYACV